MPSTAAAAVIPPPIVKTDRLSFQTLDGFPPLVSDRKVERHPTDIHFVQSLLALRIKVPRCLPKRDDPRRSHGIRPCLR
jgi:hypothetical protein